MIVVAKVIGIFHIKYIKYKNPIVSPDKRSSMPPKKLWDCYILCLVIVCCLAYHPYHTPSRDTTQRGVVHRSIAMCVHTLTIPLAYGVVYPYELQRNYLSRISYGNGGVAHLWLLLWGYTGLRRGFVVVGRRVFYRKG